MLVLFINIYIYISTTSDAIEKKLSRIFFKNEKKKLICQFLNERGRKTSTPPRKMVMI